MPFDEVMDLALYQPEFGFYAAGGRAGRRGDFITSVEVGPLFGAVMARALDDWWDQAGRPDPFVVVEAAAGIGTLARTVLAAAPACASALRYVLVERSASLRARQGEYLALTRPEQALPPTAPDADGEPQPVRLGEGPIVVSLDTMPDLPDPVIVLANELLDNLAFRIVERAGDSWQEVRVGIDEAGALCEVLVPAGEALSGAAERLAPDAASGARIPLQDAAAGWLRAALDAAGPGGRVVVLDYAATTGELAQRPMGDWLRTYRDQNRGGSPFEAPGQQDVTAEVCIDQLARVRPPDIDQSQAEFLAQHGIDELVAEGRRVWQERAHLGDLQAIKARSRVGEAEALCDPAGLGAFRVLHWVG